MKTSIRINDRNYGIMEYGKSDGFPVFYFHGFPGSRLDGNLFGFDKVAKEINLRILGIDRPGIGISDFQKDRTMLAWSQTVIAIADSLGIGKFSVLGISGGGPYALACAYAIPDRLRSVTIVAGMGPYRYAESLIGKAMLVPRQTGIMRKLIAWGLNMGVTKNPAKMVDNIKKTLPEEDINYLNKEDKFKELLNAFIECFNLGTEGYLQEAELYRRDWGFNLADIKTTVLLWHGTSDKNVTIELAKRIASEIPGCKPTFMQDEGHFSLAGNYLKEILIGLTK